MSPPAGDRGVRDAYARIGVRGYYERHGSSYRNPHEDDVRAGLARAVVEWDLDLAHVCDLACGSGEATLALRDAGAQTIDGVDPYTAAAYRERTGAGAVPLTFAEVAAGALGDRSYSLVVCSFALHLAERSRLPGLALALAAISPRLVVVTPHKRPEIRAEWGWQLTGELMENRVRVRGYRRLRDES